MKVLKVLLVTIALALVAFLAAVWWYLSSLPTMPPQSINSLPSAQAISVQCLAKQPRIAYQVKAVTKVVAAPLFCISVIYEI